MENATPTPEYQQLQALLEQYSGTSTVLPNLKAAELQGWGAPVREWFQNAVTASWEWLKALIGPLLTAYGRMHWAVVLGVLFCLCVAVLVFWLTSALANKYRRQKRPQGTQAGLPTRLASAEERLEKWVRAAVQDESWGLAARLRWRLFLCRMRCPPSVTPNEFFAAPQYRRRWEQRHGTPVSEQYRVMFSATGGSRQWHAHYHERLTGLEGDHRHA
jgi:hypothetical protein